MGVKHLHKRKKKPLIPILFVTVFLVLILASIGGLMAKYRSEMQYEAEMIAANFHFSSDLLEEEKKDVTHQVADWKDGIRIELYNYEKENEALVASDEIAYYVTLSSNEFIYSMNTTSNFPGGTKTTHTLTVTPKAASVEPATITVTVTTTSPFTKTLTATFNLVGTQQPQLTWNRIIDNGDYYLATITTGQYAGAITLAWEDGLQPDNTNEVMKNWGSATSKNSFDAEAFTTYELIFFNPNKIDGAEMAISTVDQ